MKTYDEIKTVLESALSEANANHEREASYRYRTAELLAEARDRYERFALHGMIPDGFEEDRDV